MKYVFLLATVAVVYFFIAHKVPVTPVVNEITQQEAVPLSSGPRNPPASVTAGSPSGTNALKRPIDRTREVLEQVKQRNGNGEF